MEEGHRGDRPPILWLRCEASPALGLPERNNSVHRESGEAAVGGRERQPLNSNQATRGTGLLPKSPVLVDALAHVVRAFQDETIPHEEGEVDPGRDFQNMELELIFADAESARKRVERLQSDIRKAGRAEDKTEALRSRAGAIDELAEAGVLDDFSDRTDPIGKELAQLTAEQNVEDELAALRGQLPPGPDNKSLPGG